MSEDVNTTTQMDPAMQAANKLSSGRFKLAMPIMDGEKKYEELNYDFTALTGWELAKALDTGKAKASFDLSDVQALSLFAAAAAKCTEGIDAIDIRERLSAADATTAIKLSIIFFNSTSLAGSLRITNA